RSARAFGRLRAPRRCGAGTAAGRRLGGAGGALPNGTASRAVYVFDPETRAVRALGKLPAPTTHAGAAALGNRALVVGGRSAGPNTPTARIVAVDPLSGRIRIVGRLPQPLSDAAVATLGR